MNAYYKISTLIISLLFSLTIFGQSVSKKIKIPNLVGLTYKEAKVLLQKSKVSIGAVIIPPNTTEFDTLKIVKQNPPSQNDRRIQNFSIRNQLIDIWLSNPHIYIDTLPKSDIKLRFSTDKDSIQ